MKERFTHTPTVASSALVNCLAGSEDDRHGTILRVQSFHIANLSLHLSIVSGFTYSLPALRSSIKLERSNGSIHLVLLVSYTAMGKESTAGGFKTYLPASIGRRGNYGVDCRHRGARSSGRRLGAISLTGARGNNVTQGRSLQATTMR